MHILCLLPYLLVSGEVIANHISARNITASRDTPLKPPKVSLYTMYKCKPQRSSTNIKTRSSGKNITLPDGTIIVDGEASCWDSPTAPPVPSDSTEYAKGKCAVCVSQSLPDIGILTLGSLQQYSVRVRDMTNHDMGSVNNETLAALDGHTGDKKTLLTITVAGKPFHLWTMRDPGFPWWAAVYMDWDGPGPTDPFAQPPMSYSHASDYDSWPVQMLNVTGMVDSWSCLEIAQSRDKKTVYFSCGFYC